MRVVVEPERLIKMFTTALLYKSSAMLDSVPIYFTEKGAIIRDSSLQVLAIYSIFPKHYFLEYEVDKPQKIVVTKSLLKMTKQGFKKDDTVTISVEGGNVVLSSSRAIYREPIPEIEESTFPLKFKKDENGIYLPENFEPKVTVVMREDDIKDILTADTYTIEYDGERLKITMEDIGSYTKIITPLKLLKKEKCTIRLDGDLTRRIIANLKGEIIFSFNEDLAIWERLSKEYVQIFVLSAIATAPEEETLEEESIKVEEEEEGKEEEGELEELESLSESELEKMMAEVE
mgnify:CR=1 FL=1